MLSIILSRLKINHVLSAGNKNKFKGTKAHEINVLCSFFLEVNYFRNDRTSDGKYLRF